MRSLAGVVAAGLVAAGLVAVVGASAPAEQTGVLFVESNQAQPDANSVLGFAFHAGDLRPLSIQETPTAGSGSTDLTDSGVLDADQQMIVDPKDKLLFAVNQGSDSIAVFRVKDHGDLTPVDGSPFPSGGAAPASVGLHDQTLVVVNKAQDGVRDLSAVAPNYTTFNVAGNGRLRPTGSTFTAPLGSSPTQAFVVPNGDVIVSTEESGPVRSFRLTSGGTLVQAPGSPLAPDDSLFPPGFPDSKKFALGIDGHPRLPLLYINMPTVSKLAVYSVSTSGRLTFIRGVDNAGSVLPCWTLVTRDARWLYTANAGNDTVSAFDLSDPRNPQQIQSLTLKGKGNPWNLRFDPSQQYLFVNTPRATEIVPPGEGNSLHSLRIGADGRLTELASSPVPVPVALGTQPLGLAVAGH
jgi:6-phosphogluconolactonase (cycloisomerase 2 family)